MSDKPDVYYSKEGLVLYSAMFEALFKDASLLEKVLEDAPDSFKFTSENKREFRLHNKHISWYITADRQEFSFFMFKIYPAFGIHGKYGGSEILSDRFSFSGQFEEPCRFYCEKTTTMDITLYRNEHHGYLPPANEEWFLQADKFLKKAADKHHLNNRYNLFQK